MQNIIKYLLCTIVVGLIAWLPGAGLALPADSLQAITPPDNINYATDVEILDGDIELGEISIEAVIEKPMVAILPTRLEPEVGELEFVNRSFERELKSFPGDLMISDDRLFAPKKIDDLRKKLLKKKNVKEN